MTAPRTHRFWIWQTVTADGRPAHMGTCPPDTDISNQVARSDRTHQGGAPHTMRRQEIERAYLTVVSRSEWVTP